MFIFFFLFFFNNSVEFKFKERAEFLINCAEFLINCVYLFYYICLILLLVGKVFMYFYFLYIQHKKLIKYKKQLVKYKKLILNKLSKSININHKKKIIVVKNKNILNILANHFPIIQSIDDFDNQDYIIVSEYNIFNKFKLEEYKNDYEIIYFDFKFDVEDVINYFDFQYVLKNKIIKLENINIHESFIKFLNKNLDKNLPVDLYYINNKINFLINNYINEFLISNPDFIHLFNNQIYAQNFLYNLDQLKYSEELIQIIVKMILNIGLEFSHNGQKIIINDFNIKKEIRKIKLNNIMNNIVNQEEVKNQIKCMLSNYCYNYYNKSQFTDQIIPVLFFTGPFGSGKTQGAKQLAKDIFLATEGYEDLNNESYIYFSADVLGKFDFFGPGAGYLNSNVSIQPTEKTKVIIIDEIDKVTKKFTGKESVLQHLATLITEKKFTHLGKEIDLNNVIIILISNDSEILENPKNLYLKSRVAKDYSGNYKIEFKNILQNISVQDLYSILKIKEIEDELDLKIYLHTNLIKFFYENNLDVRSMKNMIFSLIIEKIDKNESKKVLIEVVDNKINAKFLS